MYFMLCDVLVLPGCSSLAINHAMHYGKPVITVAYGGPEYELIKNGENGFVFERGNEQKLKNAILKILTNEELRLKMGKCSLDLMKEVSVENMVKNVFNAVQHAAHKENISHI